MANKPSQYKVILHGNGYAVVGRHTNRLVSQGGGLTREQAREVRDLLEEHTMDTHESFKGFYG